MNKKLNGMYFALATMFLWGCNIVFSRHAIVNLGANPYLFASIVMFVGSMVLLLVAGKGAKVDESLKHPMTWLYSTLQILVNIFTLIALLYITSTQSMFLQRINIVLGLLVGVVFLNRKISKNDFIGCVFILFGACLLLSNIEFKKAVLGMSGVMCAAIGHILRTIVAEKHPISRGAESFSEYCRVLSYILLVTSAIFLLFAFFVGFVNQIDPNLPVFNFLPTLSDMITKDQLFFATIMGVTIMPLSMYCFFYGAQRVGMDNFLIYTAYLPIVTFTLEHIANYFDILTVPVLTWKDGVSAVFIMGGALYITYYRNLIKARNKRIAPKTKKDLFVLRDTIRTARICFNDDEDKIAETLGVGKRTINKIMAKDAPVSQKIKDKIIFNHASQIASLDHLTGAMNKSSFFLKLKDLKNIEQALIMFIDLNKFKPVNDTYGHEAGDSILKGIADRLIEEFGAPHVVARLGGDEYCLIIYGTKYEQEKKYISKVKKIINEPFIVEGIKEEISVGCAVGAAHYPTEGTNGHILKEVADKRMYEDKNKLSQLDRKLSKGDVR